jgi:uncharacterized membrane protein
MSRLHEHTTAGSARPQAPGARRVTLALLVPAILATAVGLVLLWPRDTPDPPAADGPVRVLGDVLAVNGQPCPPAPDEQQQAVPGAPEMLCGTITVNLTGGPQAGTRVTTEIPNGPAALRPATGDHVVLFLLEQQPGGPTTYSIADYQRGRSLWLLAAVFALAVIAFGRWRGLTALAGLAVTFAILLTFIVPAILDGRSPIAVAVVGAAALMLTGLYLTHGFTTTTTVAVAGTLTSLTITAALSALATTATHLSGVADDTANFLSITHGEVNMRGLLLAGIVIGSLGVLDDVTVTQSATVTELATANPAYRFTQLYRAATRIGRAHIASVINTIVLAYAGASLPLMLLFAAGSTPVSELVTGELIAQELVRSAVGTIGLISAVSVTTALAALVAARRHTATRDPAPPAELPAGRPDADPWTAFVERDPGWQNRA